MNITVRDFLRLTTYAENIVIESRTSGQRLEGDSAHFERQFASEILNASILSFYTYADDMIATIVIIIE